MATSPIVRNGIHRRRRGGAVDWGLKGDEDMLTPARTHRSSVNIGKVGNKLWIRKVRILETLDYARLLRRHWIFILASTLMGLLIGGAATLLSVPSYMAQTRLFVATQNSGSVLELQQGNTFSQARVSSYVETARTPAVLQPAIDALGLSISSEEFARKVEASVEGSTVLINITVNDPSPVQAAAMAQAVGNSLIRVVDSLESPSKDGASPVKLSVVTPAIAPSQPVSPNTRLYLAGGALIGLAMGIGGAILRTALDTKIRGELDVRRITDASMLGGVAYDSDAVKKPLLTQVPSQSPRAESFRQIRTNLQFAHVGHTSKTVLVTSSLPGEGKSTTAINMAIALAQSGSSVALVDADLRRPMVGEYLGLERNAGLTTALLGLAPIENLMQSWGQDALDVLTSGRIPPNPSELLGSDSMSLLIETLESRYDAVIVDAPPLLPVTDAAVLAQRVGGVVVVVGSGQVRTKDLEKSISSLQMVKADILGIVLNKLSSKGSDAYAYTYYGTNDEPGGTERMTQQSQGDEPEVDENFENVIFGQRDHLPARRRS